MPVPQKKITLVGWAGEPVPSINEKDFCKRSIVEKLTVKLDAQQLIPSRLVASYSNPCRSRKFFTPPQPSPNSRGGSKKFTNDLGLL
jgi:hypothetical protein